LNAKIGLIVALIVTAVIGVYGIELGIRVSTGNGRFEILGVVVILLVLLFFADLILLAEHQKTSKEKFSKSILSKDKSKLS
jgi:type IV secretory pathway VirB2 component (pilin)